MSTALAAPFQQPPTFDIQYHNMSSPTHAPKQPNTRPPRARNNNANNNNLHNTQSDSGLPSQAHTPKPKKTRPRQNDHRAASSSDVPKSTRSKPNTKSPTATPAKAAAYAGPTFHASPAASNLPMPKFASKSVPPASTTNSLQAKLDAESTKSNARSPCLEAPAPATLTRERSPLDIFFNADRQERANKTTSPSVQRRITPPEAKGLFSMDMESSSSPTATHSPASVPAPVAHHSQAEADRQAYTQSLKNFLNLQPSSTSPAQPRAQPPLSFQTPQQQRTLDADPSLHYGNRNLSPLFQAARTPSSPYATPEATPKRESAFQTQPSFDPRAYLESHLSQQQSPFISARPRDAFPSPQQQQQQQPRQDFAQPVAPHPSQPPPPLQHHSSAGYSPDVKGMEAKLRGMLKLS